jgi:hypothetical protein
MKLTSAAAKAVIAEDSGPSLCRRVAELENDKNTLQSDVYHGIAD